MWLITRAVNWGSVAEVCMGPFCVFLLSLSSTDAIFCIHSLFFIGKITQKQPQAIPLYQLFWKKFKTSIIAELSVTVPGADGKITLKAVTGELSLEIWKSVYQQRRGKGTRPNEQHAYRAPGVKKFIIFGKFPNVWFSYINPVYIDIFFFLENSFPHSNCSNLPPFPTLDLLLLIILGKMICLHLMSKIFILYVLLFLCNSPDNMTNIICISIPSC